eukprot:Mycagemm_TRINITY_DN8439_c0_g1::TRINITY_DN8439_c0_g1_i1::g.4629::m.4629 type:complete len:131 gc:universal TRINITY_DN8439_c0_g1_i1:230-622(+)
MFLTYSSLSDGSSCVRSQTLASRTSDQFSTENPETSESRSQGISWLIMTIFLERNLGAATNAVMSSMGLAVPFCCSQSASEAVVLRVISSQILFLMMSDIPCDYNLINTGYFRAIMLYCGLFSYNAYLLL